MGQVGQAEGEDFGCCVGEGAAEGLVGGSMLAEVFLTGAGARGGEGTYQIKFSEPLGGVGQVYDRVVGEVCTICQNQTCQPWEGVDAPVLEADVCDRGAPG